MILAEGHRLGTYLDDPSGIIIIVEPEPRWSEAKQGPAVPLSCCSKRTCVPYTRLHSFIRSASRAR